MKTEHIFLYIILCTFFLKYVVYIKILLIKINYLYQSVWHFGKVCSIISLIFKIKRLIHSTKCFILKENLSLKIVMSNLHHQEGRFEAPSVKDVISRTIISAILHAKSSLAYHIIN